MPRPNPSPPPQSDNKPIHTIRHRAIKVAIWKNQTTKGAMYDVKVTRGYKEDETWRDSYSFGYDDLLVVAKLMNDAHSFITAQRAKDQVAAPRGNTKRREQPAV